MEKLKLTKAEIDVLLNLLHSQVTGMDREEVEDEINGNNGYFGLKSLEQAENIEKKLIILLRGEKQ